MGRRYFHRIDSRGEYYEETSSCLEHFIGFVVYVAPVVGLALYGIYKFFNLLRQNILAVTVICAAAALYIVFGNLEIRRRY